MYFIRKNILVSKLSRSRTIDFDRIRICEENYPHVFDLMAAVGTTEYSYPETCQCDKKAQHLFIGTKGGTPSDGPSKLSVVQLFFFVSSKLPLFDSVISFLKM